MVLISVVAEEDCLVSDGLDNFCTAGDVLEISVDVKIIGFECKVCVVNVDVLTADIDVGPTDADNVDCG